jgi:hypothetical protein
MTMRLRSRSLVVLFLAVAFGCDGCGERPGTEAVSATETPSTETPTNEPSGPLTTLRGVVRLAEGMEPPSFAPEDMGAQGRSTEECTPPLISDRAPLQLGEGRALSNVVVTLTAEDRDAFFARVAPLEPVRHELTIRDCRLQPRVVGAARGDVLVVSNEMYYPFLPTTGSTAFMRALIKGQPQEVPIEQVGLVPVTCAMMAGCGRTDVIVASTRLIAVTDADGRFEIPGVPTGLALRVHAWHPLLQEATAPVTLGEAHNAPVELTVRALPPREPAPTPEEPTGPAEEGTEPF